MNICDILGDAITYPELDQNGKDVQKLTSSRAEFYSLRYDQPSPDKILYRHQELTKRLMLNFDRMMIIHRPGVGKTCSMVGTSEYFHEIMLGIAQGFDAMQELALPIQRCLVVTRKSLVDNFKEEIVNKCTTRYKVTGDGKYKALRQKMLGSWYKIMSYEAFYSQFREKMNNLEALKTTIRDNWSNTLVFFDEIHTVKLAENIVGATAAAGKRKDELESIQLIDIFINNIEYSKVFLSSGTFMVNAPSDFGEFANLIIKDKFSPDTDWNKIDIDVFNRHMRGYITFMETPIVPVDLTFVGNPVTMTETFVVKMVQMSPFQTEKYLEEFNKSERRSFNTRLLNISAFAFPDNVPSDCVGDKGTQSATLGRPRRGDVRADKYDKMICNEMKEYVSKKENIQRSSPLFVFIIETSIASKYKSFVYGNMVVNSGVVLLARCYQTYGFSALSGSETIEWLESNPGNRYVLVTGDENEDVMRNKLAIFNHPNNIYGKYCKIFTASKVAREGISLDSVLNVFLPEMWNYSNMVQAMSRAYRLTSFDRLKRDTPNVLLKFNVYKMASVLPDTYPLDKNVSLHMYNIIARKEREIDRIDKFCIRVDVVCPLNIKYNDRNRNLVCFPTGDEISPDSVTHSNIFNYGSLYTSMFSSDVTRMIQSTQMTSFSIVQFEETFKDKYSLSEIMAVLDSMHTNHIPVFDKFGTPLYVAYEDGYILFQPFYTVNRYDTAYYSQMIPLIVKLDTSQLLTKTIVAQASEVTLERVKSANKEEAIVLIESIVPNAKDILDYYSLFVFEINWPARAIEQYKDAIIPTAARRGRANTFAEDKQPKYFNIMVPSGLPNEPVENKVWVHRLADLQFGSTAAGKHNLSTILTKYISNIRIFDKGMWRNADYFERAVLNAVFAQRYEAIAKDIVSLPIYGTLINDDLRIVELAKYPKGRSTDTISPVDLARYLQHFGVIEKDMLKPDAILKLKDAMVRVNAIITIYM